jgi:ubiquinone/menaquinone biosynthesis C-methylase UbiE
MCRHQVTIRNGFAAYAPELEYKQEGFKPEFYKTYAYLEEGHFWFQTRCRLILWALKRYAPNMNSFLDVGCGTGFILSKVSAMFPNASLFGSDMFSSGLHFASSRVHGVDFLQMDARNIPYIEEFEAIGAFDVIEHIEEDTDVLNEMYRALKTGGIIILTVPQHKWLWSHVDEYSCHVRRYGVGELQRKVEEAGFVVLRSTSFVTFLLPAMIVSRLTNLMRCDDAGRVAEIAVPKILNKVLSMVMWMEASLIKVGATSDIGASRLLVARK